MLSRGWSRGLAAGFCALAVTALVPTVAAADTIRDSQQWVLNMLDVQQAWAVTEGGGWVVMASLFSPAGLTVKALELTAVVTPLMLLGLAVKV